MIYATLFGLLAVALAICFGAETDRPRRDRSPACARSAGAVAVLSGEEAPANTDAY